MCKYEMDPMSIVEDTERTRFCPQTDRQTDGRMDRRTDGQGDTSIPPINFVEAGGIITSVSMVLSKYSIFFARSAHISGMWRICVKSYHDWIVEGGAVKLSDSGGHLNIKMPSYQ